MSWLEAIGDSSKGEAVECAWGVLILRRLGGEGRGKMSSAVEEFESSIISEAALSTEAFEFCDSEEDLELAKALEEYESEEGEPEAGFGLLGRADPFAVHAKGCALDARTREV